MYSTRSAEEYEARRLFRRDAYEYLPTEDRHCSHPWTLSVRWPGAAPPSGRDDDLLASVLAAEHGLALLHYDAGFEIAAEVIAVDQRWGVDRGSIP